MRVEEGLQKKSENPKEVVRPRGTCAILTKRDKAWRSDRAEEKGGLGLRVAGAMWEGGYDNPNPMIRKACGVRFVTQTEALWGQGCLCSCKDTFTNGNL